MVARRRIRRNSASKTLSPSRAASLANDADQTRKEIGHGGTSVVYATRDPAWVVKLPRRGGRLHGATDAEVLALWKHEAAVARSLRALPSVARIVFTRLRDGTPALLVERGEPVTEDNPITPDDVGAFGILERDVERINRAGWNWRDLPVILRRPNGSLFLADFGAWRKRRRGEPSDIAGLFDGQTSFGMHPWADSLSTLNERRAERDPWLAATIERRRAFGLPVR